MMVSVILPIYNAESFLPEALNSLVFQTYTDLEILAICDGSTDGSERIIQDFYTFDNRVVPVIHKDNKGITVRLNEGIAMARGKYIVRLDSDDIAKPHRIEKQVAFMEANPDIAVCGSWMEVFGNYNQIVKYPTTNIEIKKAMVCHNCIGHPSVIIRRSVLIENEYIYPEYYKCGEDYGLWLTMAQKKDIKFANIPETLIRYRTHGGQITVQQTKRMHDVCIKLIPLRNYLKLLLEEWQIC